MGTTNVIIHISDQHEGLTAKALSGLVAFPISQLSAHVTQFFFVPILSHSLHVTLSLIHKTLIPYNRSVVQGLENFYSEEMVKPKPVFILAALLLLHHGSATWCETSTPTVQQTRVGFGDPPRFAVVIKNSCAMCPAIEIHLRCGGFPQRLVNPKLLRVVGPDDCVVNDNLPLGPLQKISFSYTHQRFRLSPKSWYYQCE